MQSLPQEHIPSPEIIAATHSAPTLILDGNTAMGTFLFRTLNAVECGAKYECSLKGMIKATFSNVNKIADIEMVFDVMSMVHQLQRASGDETQLEGICPNARMHVTDLSTKSVSRPLLILQNSESPANLKITYANAGVDSIVATKCV